MKIWYHIMDGCAAYDTDRAKIIKRKRSLKEAIRIAKLYQTCKACVVKVDGGDKKLVWHPEWGTLGDNGLFEGGDIGLWE